MDTKAPIVSIQKFSYENIEIESLLAPLGGLQNYVNKGERVLLKVNLLNASIPSKAVVTNPILVKKTVEAIQKIGATPVIGDSPSGQFTKRRLNKVYEKAGLIQLSKETGVELNYNTQTKKIPIQDGRQLTKVPICNFVLQADRIIALPKIKTHSYMIMTLATKIMYGVVPGLTKAKYHALYPRGINFSDMLLDVLSVAKPDLIIMDGIIGMQGNGPAGGTPVDIGVLLAAEDALAMDISVCKILGVEPVGIPVLKRGKIRGLWPKEIKYPKLKPNDVKCNDFILPTTAGYLITGEKTPEQYPKVNSKCISCGLCEEICPKQAIKNTQPEATINYSKCIRCYCCHEVCPEEAIELEVITENVH